MTGQTRAPIGSHSNAAEGIVTDLESIAKDRRTAARIIALSAVCALALAFAAFFFP
jgi:hypothetical protein